MPKPVIGLIAPSYTFWSNDPSTHHANYPRWDNNEYNWHSGIAKDRGEKFEHGMPYFEELMRRFADGDPKLNAEPKTKKELDEILCKVVKNMDWEAAQREFVRVVGWAPARRGLWAKSWFEGIMGEKGAS